MPIRQATEADLVFVVKSWADSMKHSGEDVSVASWGRVMTMEYRTTLERPDCSTLVYYVGGVTPGVADIVGWLCYEVNYWIKARAREGGKWRERFVQPPEPLIHFCYTKHGARLQGVQKALWKAAEIDPTGPYRYSMRPKTLTLSRLPKTAQHDKNVRRYPKYPKEHNGNRTTEARP